MIIYFNTESTKIKVKTITNFASYNYNIKEFQSEQKQSENIQSDEEDFIIVNGIKIPISKIKIKCEETDIPESDNSVNIGNKTQESTYFTDGNSLIY